MGISIAMCFAAAQTSVPGGTATGMSSIVRCTNSSFFSSGIVFTVLVECRFIEHHVECGFIQHVWPIYRALGPGTGKGTWSNHAPSFADVILIFCAEQFDATGNRASGGIAQGTE